MKVMLLALALLAAVPQDKSKKKLEWKAEPNSVLEYDLIDVRTNKPSGQIFFVFASELRTTGGNRIVVDKFEDVGWPLVFQLPKDEVKPGAIWEHAAYFFHEASESTALWSWGGPASIQPVHAKGRYVLKSIDKEGVAWIDGAFELFEIRRDYVNNSVKLTVTKNKVGTVNTSMGFHVENGRITTAGFACDLPRANVRTWDKDRWSVQDKKIKETKRIQFKEALVLEKDKMKTAVDAAIERATGWLKKQQKGAGDFGSARTLETDRLDANYTGLIVRALLASGMKPEDDLIQKALKTLKSAPASKTPQSYDHQILGILAREPRTPAKEDLAVVKGAVDALLEMRDRKVGAWAPGNKRGTETINPITTRHAVDGIYHASVAGVNVPAEVWRTLLDLYSTSTMDEADEVELKLVFEDDYAGIDKDVKKAFPGSWRFNSERRPASDPMQARDTKGFAISTISVLEILAAARASTSLNESQKKNVEGAIRKGLAYLQYFWTLRTPPPAEAAWSVQKVEYLAGLMRVFTAFGIQTVDGSDWWLEGAYLLLREQNSDGSWNLSGGSELADTAWALSFLARAGVRMPAK